MNNNLMFVNSPTNFIKPIIGPLAIRNDQRSGLNVLRLRIIFINQIILKKVAMRFYSNVVFKTHCYFFDIHTYFFGYLAIGLIADRLLWARPIRLYLHPNRTTTVLSKSLNKSAVSAKTQDSGVNSVLIRAATLACSFSLSFF
jgi:hypothetical protein